MNALATNPTQSGNTGKIRPSTTTQKDSSSIKDCKTASPTTNLEPVDSVDKRSMLYNVSSNAVGAMAGMASGLSRIIVGGCAGGAQGIVQGANLKQDQTNLAFKVSMGANLALTGAIAGGAGLDFLSLSPAQSAATGAVTNVMVGRQDWDNSPGSFQDAVKQTAGKWLDSTLAKMPDSVAKGDGIASKVARGTIGEFVGLTAGVYAGAMALTQHYQAGYAWGTEKMDSAREFFAPSLPTADA